MKRAHPQRPGADPLEHVRVGAGAHRQVVLAREAERLVVEALEQEPRVVDLEDVDVGEVPVQRARVGDRVHPVEGVGEVDEPALRADRGDRVGEGQPARDLLLEEEADHLALAVGLHLLAGDHGQLAAAGELGRLERAAEAVVVGDGDRAEPDRLGVVEQVLDRRSSSRATSTCACAGRRGSRRGRRAGRRRGGPRAGGGRGRVELVELGGDGGEALRLGLGVAPRAPRVRGGVVLGEPCDRGGGELGLRPRRPGGVAMAAPAASASSASALAAVERRDEDRGLGEQDRARSAGVARQPRVDAAASRRGTYGRPESGRVRSSTSSQPGSSSSIRITPRASGRSRPRHSSTISCRFRPGRKSSVSTPGETTR